MRPLLPQQGCSTESFVGQDMGEKQDSWAHGDSRGPEIQSPPPNLTLFMGYESLASIE